MWNRHNVHKMFINRYRNPKTRNWFRYETFIHLFEFKGFSTWGERDTIFLCWLLLNRQLSTQPTRGALWISTLSFRGRNSTHCFFSNLNPRFRCVTSPISPGHKFYLDFILTSVNDASSPRAREHVRSCLHLTNPCTEPKSSHPY